MKFVKELLRSKKSLFFLLIIFGSLISIYFWFLTAQNFLINYSLNEQCPAKITRWEVQEASSDRYFLTAYFSFDAEGKSFSGKTRFAQSFYFNLDSAILALKEKAAHAESCSVWYNRENPMHSTLQKRSLRGVLFRALLSSAVLIYFVLFRANCKTLRRVKSPF